MVGRSGRIIETQVAFSITRAHVYMDMFVIRRCRLPHPAPKSKEVQLASPELSKLNLGLAVVEHESGTHQLVLKSEAAATIAKDTVLICWSDGGLKPNVNQPAGCANYELGAKTQVIYKGTSARVQLEKLLKKECNQVTKIWGFEPFVATQPPKELKAVKDLVYIPGTPLATTAIRASSGLKDISIVFVMKLQGDALVSLAVW